MGWRFGDQKYVQVAMCHSRRGFLGSLCEGGFFHGNLVEKGSCVV